MVLRVYASWYCTYVCCVDLPRRIIQGKDMRQGRPCFKFSSIHSRASARIWMTHLNTTLRGIVDSVQFPTFSHRSLAFYNHVHRAGVMPTLQSRKDSGLRTIIMSLVDHNPPLGGTIEAGKQVDSSAISYSRECKAADGLVETCRPGRSSPADHRDGI